MSDQASYENFGPLSADERDAIADRLSQPCSVGAVKRRPSDPIMERYKLSNELASLSEQVEDLSAKAFDLRRPDAEAMLREAAKLIQRASEDLD